LLTQVPTHSFVSIPLVARLWKLVNRAENAERKMYLKLTMLFLLIGFVAGLPYLFRTLGGCLATIG
jgi:hypothetical protein